MDEHQLKELLRKYQAGEATDEEIAFIESWYIQYNQDQETPFSLDERLEDSDAVWEKLHAQKPGFRISYLWPLIAVGACLLVFFYFVKPEALIVPQKTQELVNNRAVEIVPGTSKAVLTLANGRQVFLSGAENQKIGNQGIATLIEKGSGQLVYTIEKATAGKSPMSSNLVYNTISTPRGGQYWVVLSDGTRVFLNAGSSLRYPVNFSGKDRTVKLMGEGYFEVVHNDAAPFRIITGNRIIEDIGTKFNVNAYDDEPVMKTTLLEGAVQVSSFKQHVILKPGQQAQVSNTRRKGEIKVVNHANVDEAVAWKNGLFEFNRTNIKTVLNNAARWYDFEIVYANAIPNLKISGRVSRKVSFSGMMDLLKFEGLKFRKDGRTITIMN
nr:FecR domain-containing protein [Mucilaginibacter sp. L294]